MRTISFSVVKILPPLLDRTKDQTIRPAWKEQVAMTYKTRKTYETVSKPPRFKVGDEIKLMWNQRSKYQWFNKSDAIPVTDMLYEATYSIVRKKLFFNKTLGTAEITEVFDITFNSGKEYDKKGNFVKDTYFAYNSGGQPLNKREKEDLAKRDGFDSDEMFKVFDDMYDLSVPKKFYVYRWRWNK